MKEKMVGIYSMLNPNGVCEFSKAFMESSREEGKFIVFDYFFKDSDKYHDLLFLLRCATEEKFIIRIRSENEFYSTCLLDLLSRFDTLYLIHNGNGDERLFVKKAVEKGYNNLVEKTILLSNGD